MKKLLFLLVILAPVSAFSQFRWDFGGSLGASNYLGEIGGEEETRKNFIADIKLGQTRTAASGFARYRFSPLFSVKTQLQYGRIKGADSLSLNPGRVGRNLSFRNDLFELSVLGELYFYNSTDVARIARKKVDFRSYVYAGVGAVYHNPKAYFNDEWVDLRPLRTEGQANPYGKVAVVIPAGIGFHYIIGRTHKIGLELGWRTTFTDYLDDISTTYATDEQLGNDPLRIAIANRTNEIKDRTHAAAPAHYEPPSENNIGKRGDPTHNDSYIITAITYSYAIRGKNAFYKSRYNYITRKKMKKRRVRAKF